MITRISSALSLSFLLISAGCGRQGSLSPLDGNGPVAGPPVLRSEAVLTADRYARIHWTMTESNRTGTGCGGMFVSDYQPGERIGMGYKWGGWNGIDDFLEKIGLGYGTGTGGPVDYGYLDFECVVGVSCTGLVSRAWRLEEKYTLCYDDPGIENKFCDITTEIEGIDFNLYEVEGLKKGDAFINDTHTILFVYETRYRKPLVIESVSTGVRCRQMSWLDLARGGYRAIRYNNIVDEHCPEGTIVNPVEIRGDRLPFEYGGNTRNVVSMEFDRYSTDPAGRQQGPETIFLIVLAHDSVLDIGITEFPEEGIDNDLHLLSSAARDGDRMALDCIATGDSRITAPLERGTYYLIVDGGNDTPGEFVLTVRSSGV